MRSTILTLTFLLAITGLAISQGFNYQSIVRNSAGMPQANTTVFLRFIISEGSANGTRLYVETQQPSTDAYGWLNTEVGTGIPEFGTISSVNWNSGAKYLIVECGDSPNGTYSEIASSQINNAAFSGPQGVKGDKGETGPQGPQGPQGPEGPQGQQGPAGQNGTGVNIVGSIANANDLNQSYTGNIGDMVITEDTGSGYVWNGQMWTLVGQIQGPQGPQGIAGQVGPQGPQGNEGPAGPQGIAGPQGPMGNQGLQGEQGPQGIAGPAGPQGATGQQGPQGATGATGATGPQGATGAAGPQGNTGPAGPAGPQGATGPVGPQGATGAAGPQGATGAVGPAGPQGPVGPAGTYTAGTGITIAANTISAQNTTALWNASQLQGRNIWDIVPQTNQVLAWSPTGSNNPNTWQPMTLPSGSKWTESGSVIYPTGGRHVEPLATNAWDLGSANFRYRNIYLNNQPNVGSDRRIKENIKPLAYGLEAVMKFKPVQYNLIGNSKNDVSLGLIAQDVKNIIPEIVSVEGSLKRNANDTRQTDPNIPDGMHSIRYGDLIPVLIKAIQELEEKVARLELELNKK